MEIDGILRPLDGETWKELSWVSYPYVRGLSWAKIRELLRERSKFVERLPIRPAHFAPVLEGALIATRAGMVHPYLGSAWVLYFGEEDRFATLGWSDQPDGDDRKITATAICQLANGLVANCIELLGLSADKIAAVPVGDLDGVAQLASQLKQFG
jgi:hypothetical protein